MPALLRPAPPSLQRSEAVTTNQTNMKITASINSAMPTGLTLWVDVSRPAAGGTYLGPKTLGTGAVDVVSGITQLAESGIALAYSLDATPAAAVGIYSRDVTYTIVTGP